MRLWLNRVYYEVDSSQPQSVLVIMASDYRDFYLSPNYDRTPIRRLILSRTDSEGYIEL